MSKKAKAMTKSQLLSELATKTGLTKVQVESVLYEAFPQVVSTELKAGRPITVAGLCKIAVKLRPATKARQGRNLRTGETIMIPPKPAKKVVRVRALKGLKDMI